MRPNSALLAASIVSVAAASACQALSASPYVTALAAGPLVFVLPGAALLRALRIDLAAPGRHAVAVGLSVTLCLLGGLLLAGISLLTPLGWLLWLGGTTLGGAFIALRRGEPTRVLRCPPIPKVRHVALFAATLGVLAIAALTSARNRKAYLPFPYTSFWMLASGPASNLYVIGIKSGEHETQHFTLRVIVDGAIIGIWTDIVVAPGETVTRAVTLSTGRQAEAWLLRDATPVEVYRKASVSLPRL